MSLKIMMGASGHGKTYRLYEYIIRQALDNPGRDYYIMVPEQSSVQAEKDIVRMHPRGGVFNITVLTFGRMAYRIFDELGVESPGLIDDTGKNLIIRRILENVSDRFKILKTSRRQGFISQLKSIISELKQYGIKPDELNKISRNVKTDRLRDKLTDINILYEEFEEYISGRYMTAEDRPEKMLNIMDDSVMFKDSVVVFDNFTGFTPIQYKIMEKIMRVASEVVLSVTMPADEKYNVMGAKENDLFYMSKTIIRKAGEIADRLAIKTEYIPVIPDTSKYRFARSEELDFLEKNIFRYNGKKYQNPVKDISVYKMETPRDELLFAASAILNLIRNEHMRFRDIAIVTGNMDMYSDMAVRIFRESGIPFFIDNKMDLLGDPLVEYVRGALRVVSENFSYESVFGFLKNTFCTIDRENVHILENYVIAYGIKGESAWSENFIRKYPGKQNDMLVVNDTRKLFYEMIKPLWAVFKNKDVTVSMGVRALYEFMENLNLYEAMEELWKKIEDNAKNDIFMLARADRYRQTYNSITGLLEQMDTLLGNEQTDAEEFCRILDAGFQEIKVGIIPPGVDCVTVGNIERTRLEHIKVLFLLGANEGILLSSSDNNGILSENERKILTEMDVELAPSSKEQIFIQNYYLYLNLTEPENALYITWHALNMSGEEVRPSRICQMIKNMYPKLEELSVEGTTLENRLSGKKNSFHLALSDAGGNDNLMLLKYFLNTEPYAEEIRGILEMIERENTSSDIEPDAALRLYEDMKTSSISRIERYALCAFSHFASYGLELKKREEYGINSMDLGNVFHKSLEIISNSLKSEGRDFSHMDNAERNKRVEEAVDKAVLEYEKNFFYDSSTTLYIKNKITRMVSRTVWALGKQLKNGSFKPVDFEKSFSENVGNISILGKIDRVDVCENENEEYVKIIDYKSGRQTLSVEEVYAGIKLQLMVYLKSVIDERQSKNPDKTVRAAAVLYNRIDDPIVDNEDAFNDEKYENAVLDKLKPTGMVGIESIDMLDSDYHGSSHVIPASSRRSESMQTDEKLKSLAEYATAKMVELQKEINEGSAGANPYEDACINCEYKNICGFDEKKTKYRKLKEQVPGKEDIWSSLGFDLEKEE